MHDEVCALGAAGSCVEETVAGQRQRSVHCALPGAGSGKEGGAAVKGLQDEPIAVANDRGFGKTFTIIARQIPQRQDPRIRRRCGDARPDGHDPGSFARVEPPGKAVQDHRSAVCIFSGCNPTESARLPSSRLLAYAWRPMRFSVLRHAEDRPKFSGIGRSNCKIPTPLTGVTTDAKPLLVPAPVIDQRPSPALCPCRWL